MKKITLFLLLISAFSFAQMPNIEKVWLNNSKPYVGAIDKGEIKVKINTSEQDKKNDQEYFVSGYTLVDGSNYSKFEGKLKIDKYKDHKKSGKIFGTYELVEELKGKHSGKFTGKFVYSFKWNKESEKVENQEIDFSGDWKSYDAAMSFKTDWNNQPKK